MDLDSIKAKQAGRQMQLKRQLKT